MNIDSISTILIDFDGVLCSLNHDLALKRMEPYASGLLKPPNDILRDFFYKNPLHFEIDTGSMSYKEMLFEIAQPLWKSDSGSWLELWDEIWDSYAPNIEVISIAERLSEQGKKVAIVSDNHSRFSNWMKNQPDLQRWSQLIYSSAECGHTKASGELFSYVVADLDVNTKDCWFIDDSFTNVKTARSLGFHGIHYPSQINELHTILNIEINKAVNDYQ